MPTVDPHMLGVCKACKQSSDLSYFIEKKKVILCSYCKSIYNEENIDEKIPSIVSKESRIKISIQKQFSKLVAESYLKYLESKIDFSFKTAFDIGAGFGSFVQLLNESNIDTVGIESDESTVDNAVTKNITHGVFDENYFSKVNYDFISLNQCLYYFQDSFSILHKITKMLNNNGLLFIATVNPESIFRLTNKIWTQGCKMCLSKQVFELLEQFGLELINVTEYDDNLHIDYFLHRKGELSDAKFWQNVLFYFLKLKNIMSFNSNGINNFILLKKI